MVHNVSCSILLDDIHKCMDVVFNIYIYIYMKCWDGYFTFMDGILLENMRSDSCARYVLFN